MKPEFHIGFTFTRNGVVFRITKYRIRSKKYKEYLYILIVGDTNLNRVILDYTMTEREILDMLTDNKHYSNINK